MNHKVAILITGLIAGLGVFSSCKKAVEEKKDETTPTLTDTRLKDSVLIYSRELYLWYNQIPSTFNPQNYSDPTAIMNALRVYSSDPGFATADRWSYAMKKSEWDQYSMGLGSTLAEDGKDLGLSVFFRTEGDLRVRHVEKESPAGLAGVRRGWRISKINGSTNISTTNSAFIVTGVYENASGTFTFQKPDGTSVDITLNAANYFHRPVVLDSVYTAGTKKVGYLVFNSFIGDTTQINSELDRVFTRFTHEQVNEVIVDLRYNGGGYVKVQQRLANYLINSSYNGQVMMSETFNSKYTRYNTTARFSKLGTLNLSRVSFIVSSSTASASELLINNLKPYLDVRLVGPSKTHGKPVGFFPYGIGEWYVFPVSFRTVNKNGEGNYFGGLTLNNAVPDGLDKDWGDINESCLGFIINGLKNGTYRIGTSQAAIDPQIEAVNSKLSENEFRGAIDTRQMF